MRTESDRKEYTQDKRPEPALFAVCVFEPFADTMIMLMVVVSAEEQHYAADEHEPCQYRFAPMRQQMLNTVGLRPRKKRNTQQNIRR